jgi:hypothetical protein
VRLAAKLATVAKQDSSPAATAAKLRIRRNVLDVIGAKAAHVFDAFAGTGHMHDMVWRDAVSYVGCDNRFFRDDRVCFCADNVRVLRAIDIAPFNLFDLDAYGSPWEAVIVIAARRKLAPGERVGFVLTDGQGMNMRLGSLSIALSQLAGVRPDMVGIIHERDAILDRGIARLALRMGAVVERRWQAHGTRGSSMRYIGLVLRADQSGEKS